MTAKGDLVEAGRDLALANRIAKLQAAGGAESILDSIEIDLADLQFERGQANAAMTAYRNLGTAFEKAQAEFVLGVVRQRLGDVYLEDLELDRAKKHFDDGSAIFEQVKGNLGTMQGREIIRDKRVFTERLGNLAMSGYEEAGAILAQESARASSSSMPTANPSRIFSQNFYQKHVEEGQKNYRDALKELEALTDRDNLYVFRHDIVELQTELGVALEALGDRDALQALKGALQSAKKLNDEVNNPAAENGEVSHPDNADVQGVLVRCRIELGKFYLQKRAFDLAGDQYKSAEDIATSWNKKVPDAVRWKEALAAIHDGLGDVHLSHGKWDEARKAYHSAFEIRKELTRPETSSGKRMLDLAVSEYELASLEDLAGGDRKLIADYRSAAINILTELRSEGRLPPIAQSWPELFGGAS